MIFNSFIKKDKKIQKKELKISLHPLSWPINMGKEFKGVYLY